MKTNTIMLNAEKNIELESNIIVIEETNRETLLDYLSCASNPKHWFTGITSVGEARLCQLNTS